MAQKKTAAQRKAENKGVKGGTVRAGAKGKQLRQYNEKTGRWDIIKKSYGSPRMAQEKKATGASTKSVSAARAGDSKQRAGREAQAKATAKQAKSPSSGKSWYQAGGGGLVGPNSPLAKKPAPRKPPNKSGALTTSPMTWGMKKKTK